MDLFSVASYYKKQQMLREMRVLKKEIGELKRDNTDTQAENPEVAELRRELKEQKALHKKQTDKLNASNKNRATLLEAKAKQKRRNSELFKASEELDEIYEMIQTEGQRDEGYKQYYMLTNRAVFPVGDLLHENLYDQLDYKKLCAQTKKTILKIIEWGECPENIDLIEKVQEPLKKILDEQKKVSNLIREKIKKPSGELTKADLKKVKVLDISRQQLTDVSALPRLTQLKELNLSGNQITDVSALAKLTQLKKLHLSNNRITDVGPLVELKQLNELDLFGNKIADVNPLAELTQLKKLHLSNNRITDVSALTELTQLKELGLDNNPNLTKIEIDKLENELPSCNIEHNAKLSAKESAEVIEAAIREKLERHEGELTKTDFDKVAKLEIQESQIGDVSALAELTQLKELDLDDNHITDVGPLMELKQLNELDLSGNKITDVSPLAELTQLKGLGLYNNQITDVSALAVLTELEKIDLKNNSNLTKAEIDKCKKALPGCSVKHDHMTDAEKIEIMIREELNKPSGELTEADFGKVESLYLSDYELTDISYLSRFTRLQKLFLDNNQLNNLEPLAELAQIKRLILYSNQFNDLKSLSGLKKLEWLDLRGPGNPGLSKAKIDKLQKTLPKCLIAHNFE